jgi:hypothetical protein
LYHCFENDSFDDTGLTLIIDPKERCAARFEEFQRFRLVDSVDAANTAHADFEPKFLDFCEQKMQGHRGKEKLYRRLPRRGQVYLALASPSVVSLPGRYHPASREGYGNQSAVCREDGLFGHSLFEMPESQGPVHDCARLPSAPKSDRMSSL